ncbi:hypothetical protein [Methylocystis sp.]|uniref:hypothetical protein n=1 Tax=Methylocystis sp. TaxID=1911079 RepID=UPI003D10C8D9
MKIRAIARAKVERHFIQDCALRYDRVGHKLKFKPTHRPISAIFEVFKSPAFSSGEIPDRCGIMTRKNRYFSEV